MSDIVERLRKAANDPHTVSTTVRNGVRNVEIGCNKELLLEAADEIEELLAERNGKWISLKDRWPEEGVWVLCIHEAFADAEHTFKDKQYDKIWSINAYGGYTHWMPFPEPPKEDEEL